MGQLSEQYRPKTWADVAGQDAAVRAIRTVLDRGWGGRCRVRVFEAARQSGQRFGGGRGSAGGMGGGLSAALSWMVKG